MKYKQPVKIYVLLLVFVCAVVAFYTLSPFATAQRTEHSYGYTRTTTATSGGYAYGNDTATDSGGNTYVGGAFAGTVDFDPGAGTDNRTTSATEDTYISKFNADGSYAWTKTWGATGYDIAWGIAIDSSGNI